jgi:hypothetical protein
MRIVEALNGANGFGGKPKADCYLCHRGEAKYAFSEPKENAIAPPKKADGL